MFNIAIVEDEALERRALRSIIDNNIENACIIGEAKNGAEAVALLENESIDLLLLDIKIPRPNGLEILRMVRERRLQTKVLIITAYDYFDIMQAAIQFKADGFLLKPVRRDALLGGVRDCLGSSLPATPSDAKMPAVPQRHEADCYDNETGDDLREALQATVSRHAYRECLWLVRRRLETLYAHRAVAPRHEVLDLAQMLMELLERKEGRQAQRMEQQVEKLESERLDARNQHNVHELFGQILDALFEVDLEHGGPAIERFDTVLHFIERNLAKGVTLEDAADFAHVSPCYLSRLFRKKMNTTFISYLKEQRMERAKTLLQNSDLPIINISLDLSFSDANYFGKAFKKEVGISPSEYRRQFQG